MIARPAKSKSKNEIEERQMSPIGNTMMSEVSEVKSKRLIAAFVVALIATVLFVLPTTAFAGSGGTEFDPIWTMLEGWIKGTLGRVIALIMIIVGVTFGIRQQNIMAFVMGPAAGIGLFYSPTIISAMMTAGVVVAS
jgi:conjugal transfer pilus assembly protein TraA